MTKKEISFSVEEISKLFPVTVKIWGFTGMPGMGMTYRAIEIARLLEDKTENVSMDCDDYKDSLRGEYEK